MRFAATFLPAALLAVAAGAVQAQTPAAPATPEHTFTANVGLYSEYLFRGIAQTAGKPAVQGGFDYAHASGFYAGTWATNISWLEDFGLYSRSSLEWDFYGGFKNTFPDTDFTYDVGLLYYYYPGKRSDGVVTADTLEAYGSLGWKWVSGKLSYTLSDDYFGTRPAGNKTRGTMYWEANVAYPIEDTGLSILAHYGYLDVDDDGSGDFEASYSDWRLGVSYVVPEGVVKGLEIGAYYSGNNATRAFYTDLTGYDTSKDRGVVYVKKTF
jgi:uncharacterized protein (TIGR02001 family)